MRIVRDTPPSRFSQPAGVAKVAATSTLVLLMSACSTPEAAPTPTETPVAIEIPEGCPTSAEYGAGSPWIQGADGLPQALDLGLLNGELSTALPSDGCAYVVTAPESNGTDSLQQVEVMYYNADFPGRTTTEDLSTLVESMGGTLQTEIKESITGTYAPGPNDYDLPTDFSGWSNGEFLERSGAYANTEALAPYYQGNMAEFRFWLKESQITALLTGATNSASPDEHIAGLTSTFERTFTVTNTEGYTVSVSAGLKLSPFTTDPADSPPGFTNIDSDAIATTTWLNTTTGRNSRAPGITYGLIYPIDSVVCHRGGEVHHLGSEGSYCVKTLAATSPIELSVDESRNLEIKTAEAINYTDFADLGDVPEDGPHLAAFNEPVGAYAILSQYWVGDPGCEMAVGNQGGKTEWFISLESDSDPICA